MKEEEAYDSAVKLIKELYKNLSKSYGHIVAKQALYDAAGDMGFVTVLFRSIRLIPPKS